MKDAQSAGQGPLARMSEELHTRQAYEKCYYRFGFFALYMLLPLAVLTYLTYTSTGQFPAPAVSAALAVYAVGVSVGEVLMRRALKSALGISKTAKPLSGDVL